MQAELAEKREEFLAEANKIKDMNSGKEVKTIRKAMEEANIPMEIINEVQPEEKSEEAK